MAFVAALSTLALLGIYDWMTADAFMTLYAGRWLVEQGVPSTDPFTAMGAGRAWINSQWAANVVFYLAYELAGYAAVTRLSILAVASSLTLLALLLRSRGASATTTVLGSLWTLVVAIGFVPPRAQNLVLPLFALLVWIILDDDRRATRQPDRGRPWRTTSVLIVILVAWSNLHGSAVMAGGLVVIYACWRLVKPGHVSRRPWVALSLGAPTSLLATPYGIHMFGSHVAVSGNSALLANTPEWASVLTPTGAFHAGVPAAIGIVAALLGWRSRTQIQSPLLLGVLLLAVASLLQARYVLWLGFLETVLVADLLTMNRRPASRRPAPLVLQTLRGATAVMMVLIVVMMVRTERDHQLRFAPRTTVDAAHDEYVRMEDPLVLGDLGTSAMLLWQHPDTAGQILYDPRLEVFRSSDLMSWYRFREARSADWFGAAERVDIAMASESWNPRLARRLAHQPGRAITTNDGVVLVRNPTR